MPTPYALSSDLVSAWPAKSLEVATYLDTALAAKTDTAMVQNAQTGTSYSYALADASKLLSMSNAASNTVLVTKQATVTWVTGTQLRVVNLGAGVTTLVADTGVTINGNVALKQYQGGTLIRTASDVWLFVPTASGSGMDLLSSQTITAQSALNIDSILTSAYANYRVTVQVSSISANARINLLMRASGVATTTGYRWSLNGYANSTAAALVESSSGSVASLALGYAMNGNNVFRASFDLITPQLAEETIILGHSHSLNSAYAQTGVLACGGYQTAATQFDGIGVSCSTGNMTMTTRIYGYRNS